MTNKIAWIIFGSSSEMAKSLIQKLSENKSYDVYCVSRTKSGQNTDNVFYFDFASFKNNLHELEGVEIYSVLFNGKVFFKKFSDITKDDLDEMIEANLSATIFYLQSILKENLNVKKVLIVGSRSGQITGHHKYFSLYAATKTACLGLIRSLSAEFPNTLFTYFICPATDTDVFMHGVVDQELLVDVKSKENTLKKSPAQIAEIIKSALESQAENMKDLIM